jgi:hypothetical protein
MNCLRFVAAKFCPRNRKHCGVGCERCDKFKSEQGGATNLLQVKVTR